MYHEIAEDLVNIFISGSYSDSWPIGSALASDIITKYFITDLIKYVSQNPRLYPLESSDFFLMLNPRTIPIEKKSECMKTLFANIRKTRIDLYFRTSIELKTDLVTIPDTILDKSTKDYHKVVFLLSNLSELQNPIFRRLNHDIYTKNNKLYRYYRLDKEYVVISRCSQLPKLNFFGHVLQGESINSAAIFVNGKPKEFEEIKEHLSQQIQKYNQDIKFETDQDRCLYVLNACRKHIGLNALKNIFFEYDYKNYIVTEDMINFAKRNMEKTLNNSERYYQKILEI